MEEVGFVSQNRFGKSDEVSRGATVLRKWGWHRERVVRKGIGCGIVALARCESLRKFGFVSRNRPENGDEVSRGATAPGGGVGIVQGSGVRESVGETVAMAGCESLNKVGFVSRNRSGKGDEVSRRATAPGGGVGIVKGSGVKASAAEFGAIAGCKSLRKVGFVAQKRPGKGDDVSRGATAPGGGVGMVRGSGATASAA